MLYNQSYKELGNNQLYMANSIYYNGLLGIKIPDTQISSPVPASDSYLTDQDGNILTDQDGNPLII